MLEKTLEVRLVSIDDNTFAVDVSENESGEFINKLFHYKPYNHPEFNEWISTELYSWVEIMQDEREDCL